MRNTKRWRRLAAAGCLGLAAAAPLRAQAAAAAESGGGGAGTPAPELHYENGRVLEPYLPYSRPFVITGSPVTSKGRADVVWGRIYDRRNLVTPVTTNCWVRPESAGADTRFRTLFDPLTLGRRYEVQLNFGQRIPEGMIRRSLRTGLRRATNEAEDSMVVSEDFISRNVAQAIAEEVASQLGTRPLYLEITREGDCGLTGNLTVHITPEDDIKLRGAIAASLNLRAAQARLKVHSDSVQKITAHPLFDALRAARATHAGLQYSLADVQALQEAHQLATTAGLSEAAYQRLDALLQNPAPAPPELQPHLATLDALLSTLGRLNAAEQPIRDLTDRVDQARASLETIGPQLQGQFIPISEASVLQTSWGSKAEVRTLQIGTAVNGASVLFGPGGATRDAIMVAALRFYLAPVDRSLPTPWSSPRARAAIDIGALFQSEIRFRGQKQNDLFNGISPTLGVSYDLTRYLSVTGGMLFFRQPSSNPLADSTGGRVRTAMYLGVGTDFDALNQLKGLLTNR